MLVEEAQEIRSVLLKGIPPLQLARLDEAAPEGPKAPGDIVPVTLPEQRPPCDRMAGIALQDPGAQEDVDEDLDLLVGDRLRGRREGIGQGLGQLPQAGSQGREVFPVFIAEAALGFLPAQIHQGFPQRPPEGGQGDLPSGRQPLDSAEELLDLLGSEGFRECAPGSAHRSLPREFSANDYSAPAAERETGAARSRRRPHGESHG
jgi:hypothetical protein